MGRGAGETSTPAPSASPAPGTALRPAASTDERIAALEAAVRAAPGEVDNHTLLAAAYLQKARESGDGAYYDRADRALARALALAPGDAGALTERGALRLARHDFRGALSDGRRAHRSAPDLVKPYGVLVDAYVELGRYGPAGRTLQRMIDLKPDLAAYARVSYFRELHGDLRGAVRAMRLAVAAGGGTAENTAYVHTLLGELQFLRGRHGAAERSYREVLAQLPDHAGARAGLASVRAARGEHGAAIRILRGVVGRVPLPEHMLALAETELAAGRPADAARHLAQVRDLATGGGVNADTELALFEAGHGDPRRAVALGRRAWSAAPSVRSADALGWALTRAGRPQKALAWARRALKLGSRDPMFLFHAGIAARDAGHPALARRRLTRALADDPRFSPLWAPRARRALSGLR